jgi:DnaA N-terminal domain
MELKRLTGVEAGSMKYDVLTAMAIAGLHGTSTQQTSMMRLIALVTARYNWRRDELTVGQRDMARMWDVNERTVKREIKRLTKDNILICKRVGVRGRVGAYRLNLVEIGNISQKSWGAVGPDFDDRMTKNLPQQTTKVVKVDFGTKTNVQVNKKAEDTEIGTWNAVLQTLKSTDAASYSNWYARLTLKTNIDGKIELNAPNKFVANYIQTHLHAALHKALEQELGVITQVRILV